MTKYLASKNSENLFCCHIFFVDTRDSTFLHIYNESNIQLGIGSGDIFINFGLLKAAYIFEKSTFWTLNKICFTNYTKVFIAQQYLF